MSHTHVKQFEATCRIRQDTKSNHRKEIVVITGEPRLSYGLIGSRNHSVTALPPPTLRQLLHRIGDSFSRRLSELLGEKVVWEFQFQVAPPNRAQHVRPALTRLATCKVSRRPSVVAQKRASED